MFGVKLVILVVLHVPLETIIGVEFRLPSVPPMDRKRVKTPLPLAVPLEFTEQLPSSNNQSLPPDWWSTTTTLNPSPVVVGGGGVEGLTVSVTGSVAGLFETAEEVNVTLPL